MRLNSLYKFYQSHFGYPKASSAGQRLAFGWAIADCMKVLREVYEVRNLTPIDTYEEYQYARELTIEFLDNLRKIVMDRFKNPLVELEYYDYEINVDTGKLLSTRKRGLQIKSPFLWNPAGNEMIFLTFGRLDRTEAELGVFLTLSENLSTTRLSIRSVRQYTYWSLAVGAEASCLRTEIQPAPVDALVATCNRLLGKPSGSSQYVSK